MPDYGGITFGGFGGWGGGNSYGGMGGGYGPSRYSVPRSTSAGFRSQTRPFMMGGTSGYNWGMEAMLGQNAQNANATIGEHENALFDQSINERNMALQHRYAMEMQSAQLQAQQQAQWQQMLMAGINMPTNAQIDTARGRFGQSANDYRNMADNGLYSDEQESALALNAYNQVGATTKNMQQNANTLAASQGLGLNPNAIYYMGNAGQYQQAAARAGVMSDLARQEAGARERGMAGYAGIQGQLSDLDITPTRENAWLGMMGPQMNSYGQPPMGGKRRNQPLAYGNRGGMAPPRIAGGGY